MAEALDPIRKRMAALEAENAKLRAAADGAGRYDASSLELPLTAMRSWNASELRCLR